MSPNCPLPTTFLSLLVQMLDIHPLTHTFPGRTLPLVNNGVSRKPSRLSNEKASHRELKGKKKWKKEEKADKQTPFPVPVFPSPFRSHCPDPGATIAQFDK
jgi:hypothetical protein